jgi:hypothetical protein
LRVFCLSLAVLLSIGSHIGRAEPAGSDAIGQEPYQLAQALVGPAGSAPPAKTLISPKPAATSKAAPVAIDPGEVVKGRLGESDKTGQYHYWTINAPPGRYRIVMDAKPSGDTRDNVQTTVTAIARDGTELKTLVDINEIEYRTRGIAEFNTTDGSGVILRVANNIRIVDYWLGVYRIDDAVPTPFFVRTPPIRVLDFGKSASIALPTPQSEAWYMASFNAADYKLTAEFRRKDRQNSNIQAAVETFGLYGEPRPDQRSVCDVNEIDVAATCETKLVFAGDTKVLLRVRPNNDAAYDAKLTIEPLAE